MYQDDYTDIKHLIRRKVPKQDQAGWLDTLRVILQLPTYDH